MSQASVIRLIKSLSKVEKRQFKLATKKQAGSKEYLDLFDIIDSKTVIDTVAVRKKFRELYPEASLDNTARYLLKVLIDSLIQSKVKEDTTFHLLHGLMRTRLLYERSLPDESLKELKKLQVIAASSQNDYLQYLTYRHQLDYISSNDFTQVSEQRLTEMQLQSREVLKGIRNIHEHHSLYELLKYRLIHSGKILSEEKKRKLNDLILSEMALVTSRSRSSYQSRKLHLLFQSYFFTDIGDYKSAVKTFLELNRLFEQHSNLWGHPPVDYLSALDGILDSLRTIGYYDDISFYLEKMKQLDNASYPEYFRFMVKKSELIYRISQLTGRKDFRGAVAYIETLDPTELRAYGQVDDEKQTELMLYMGLAYFGLKRFKIAQKHINKIILMRKPNYQSVVYRASLLLNILIDYETNNHDYMEYEIRSYKRVFPPAVNGLKIEKLVFKTIQNHPHLQSPQKAQIFWKKIEPVMLVIEKDKFENQLHKYFDFLGWVRAKYGKESVQC